MQYDYIPENMCRQYVPVRLVECSSWLTSVLVTGMMLVFAMAVYVKVLDSRYLKIMQQKGKAPEKDERPCLCQ